MITSHQSIPRASLQAFSEKATEDPEAFWQEKASYLEWFSPWKKVLTWDPPYAQWFVDGKINACYNCLDRHLGTPTAQKKALLWEGERGETRQFTYKELHEEVCRFSNVLKSFGIQKGDRIAIYLPMVPEALVAMLSCARIGAVHTVVFAGFSSQSLRDRIFDAEAKLLITADGGVRKGKIIPLKSMADTAIEEISSLQTVIVLQRTNEPVLMRPGRDFYYNELMKTASSYCPPEEMDAEDMLFILYTSGSTGKPKGIVHTTGGYLLGATLTTQWVFDPRPSDIYWCTADIGWITGHSYLVYGPLSNGMTQLMYEGAPDFPERNRFWKLIEKYGVTIFYTAPTSIRTFMKWGENWLEGCDLSSLRLLGSVGEPINPEAWSWYHRCIGQERCPIVDTWWQTETGSILIAPIPFETPLKPGSATRPLPGIQAAIVDETGQTASSGNLVITFPWPSMLRGIYKDPRRFEETYWKKGIDRFYFTGDGARCDEDGYFWITGRVDDVINVSGHRLGTMEIESALIENNLVAEAAAIGISDPIKGQAIAAFVILKEGVSPGFPLEESLKMHVAHKIGALARPEKVVFLQELPKTRSGKIMRRLLRDIGEGRALGDTTTLADPSVLKELQNHYKED